MNENGTIDLPRIFRLAKNVSKHSDYKIKVGCVIVDHSTPISTGFNKIKYNKIWGNPIKATIHAEALAMKNSGKDYLKNSIAFIYREFSNGMPALAKPCSDCEKRLRDFGVKRVYYTVGEFPYFEVMEL
jgi:deoxycytidylate deaminase